MLVRWEEIDGTSNRWAEDYLIFWEYFLFMLSNKGYNPRQQVSM
jgi:hypothetical protein